MLSWLRNKTRITKTPSYYKNVSVTFRQLDHSYNTDTPEFTVPNVHYLNWYTSTPHLMVVSSEDGKPRVLVRSLNQVKVLRTYPGAVGEPRYEVAIVDYDRRRVKVRSET